MGIYMHVGIIKFLKHKCTTFKYIQRLAKIGVMHWGLPWAGAQSEVSVAGGS
jgi:hypothetical protein